MSKTPQDDLLREALEDARDAIASLPEDALGTASELVTHPDGERGLMSWPIRDELMAKINRALDEAEVER